MLLFQTFQAKERPDQLIDRALALAFLAYLLLPWLVPYPPLVDFPQHVAQVALLHDLTLGVSPWAEELRVNLFTPYLIGYLPAFLLSFIVTPLVACKLVLSLSFIAFFVVSLRLITHFGGSRVMLWFLLPAFHGFAWQAGLYTFVVAAPICLLFILVSARYTAAPDLKGALGVAEMAALLFFSHLLLFLFALPIAGLLLLRHQSASISRLVAVGLPYLTAAPLLGLYIAAKWDMRTGPVIIKPEWSPGFYRLVQLFNGAFDGPMTGYYNMGGLFFIMLLVFSMLVLMQSLNMFGQLRIFELSRQPENWIFAGVLMTCLLLLPKVFLNTELVPMRFAILLVPALALCLQDAPGGRGIIRGISICLFMLCCIHLTVLARSMHVFKDEVASFRQATSKVPDAQRVLYLIYDDWKVYDPASRGYGNFALSYQIERKGWVDFNFASYFPQVVRFRKLQAISDQSLGWIYAPPEKIDWNRYYASNYDYLFVRNRADLPADFLSDAPCTPRLVNHVAPWWVFDIKAC